MPGAEVAQYGVAVFALAGVFYLGGMFFRWMASRKPVPESSPATESDPNIVKVLNDTNEVIKNNTRAIESLSGVVQMLRIDMTRQEAKMDELLERARR